jgi:RNA polymerase sigma-70 factor, ECF subfamily
MSKKNETEGAEGLDRQIRENLRRVFEDDSRAALLPDRIAELIERIREQDADRDRSAASVGEDVIAQVPNLLGFARSLTRNADQAEDLVQDTVLKALSNLDKFRPGTNLRAWLFTILRNQFYSTKRKGKWEVEDAEGKLAARLVQIPDQEPRMAFEEFRRVFNGLPSDQREALMLVGVSGFSYEEAAETCGCAVGTIKSRVNRGRTRLARELDMARNAPIEVDAAVLGAVTQSRSG